MRYRTLVSSLIFFGMSMCLCLVCHAQPTRQSDSQHLLVQLDQELKDSSSLVHWLSLAGLVIGREVFRSMHIYRIAKTDGNDFSDSEIEALSKRPELLYAGPDRPARRRTAPPPDDPLYFEQWYLDRIGAEEAWEYLPAFSQSPEVVTAILESGCDTGHPDLSGSFWTNDAEIDGDGIDNDFNGYTDDVSGWNYSSGTDQHELDLHGTQIAGLIAAKRNNRKGISGLASPYPLLLLSKSEGAIYESDILQAMDYVYRLRKSWNESNGQKGALIAAMSFSLGFTGHGADDFPLWCAAFDHLGEEGILSVAATANLDIDVDVAGDAPTSCSSPYLVTVTASDREDDLMEGSGYGAISIDLSAPGDAIMSTVPFHDYSDRFSGTSLAAPLVSATISLMYGSLEDGGRSEAMLAPSELALCIKSGVLDNVDRLVKWNGLCRSEGRLNAARAVKRAGGCLPSGGSIHIHPIQIYPNPASTELWLKIPGLREWHTEGTPVQTFIFGTGGNRMLDVEIDEQNIDWVREEIWLAVPPSCPSGIYIVQLVSSGTTAVGKCFIYHSGE